MKQVSLFFKAKWPVWLGLMAVVSAGPVFAQTAASMPGAVTRKNVVVLGDSLAAGYGLDPSDAFPALLQTNVDARGWNFTVINAGVSGDTSAGGLRRVNWLLKQRMDVLILELGGNDGLRGFAVGTIKTNLQAIIDRVHAAYPQAEIIIAGMQMPPNFGVDYTSSFQKIYPELAAANHAALIPFLLEGVGGHPDLNQADQIHPTVAGDKMVAATVWKVLEPILKKLAENKT